MARRGGSTTRVNSLKERELSSLSISSDAGPNYRIFQDPGEEVRKGRETRRNAAGSGLRKRNVVNGKLRLNAPLGYEEGVRVPDIHRGRRRRRWKGNGPLRWHLQWGRSSFRLMSLGASFPTRRHALWCTLSPAPVSADAYETLLITNVSFPPPSFLPVLTFAYFRLDFPC